MASKLRGFEKQHKPPLMKISFNGLRKSNASLHFVLIDNAGHIETYLIVDVRDNTQPSKRNNQAGTKAWLASYEVLENSTNHR
jgi:hypothetical protein